MPIDQTTWRYVGGKYNTVLPQGGRWAYFIVDFKGEFLAATAGVKEGGATVSGNFLGQHGLVWQIQ